MHQSASTMRKMSYSALQIFLCITPFLFLYMERNSTFLKVATNAVGETGDAAQLFSCTTLTKQRNKGATTYIFCWAGVA